MDPFAAAVAGSVCISLAYLGSLAGYVVWCALQTGGRQTEAPDSDRARASSRMTMPVSLVVPVGASSETRNSIRALLGVAYPEFEVIVIVDRDSDALAALNRDFGLEPIEYFYRRILETAQVRRMFRSEQQPRLIVVEKDPSTTVDTWNVGVSLARFRFVGVIPPEVSVDSESLLRAMGPALREPACVVGVVCPVERVRSGGTLGSVRALFVRLHSVRALAIGRLFGARAAGVSDYVYLWRRDALLRADGFSGTTANAIAEISARIEAATHGRIAVNREIFGHTPLGWAFSAGAQPQLGESRRLGWWVGAAARAWLVVGSAVGAWQGIWTWWAVVGALFALSFGNAAVLVAAIIVRGGMTPRLSAGEVPKLIGASPFELVGAVARER